MKDRKTGKRLVIHTYSSPEVRQRTSKRLDSDFGIQPWIYVSKSLLHAINAVPSSAYIILFQHTKFFTNLDESINTLVKLLTVVTC